MARILICHVPKDGAPARELGAALMGVIFYATFPLFVRAWRNDEFFGVQGMFTAPSWPIQFVVLLGASFAAVQYCAVCYHSLRTAFQGFGRQR